MLQTCRYCVEDDCDVIRCIAFLSYSFIWRTNEENNIYVSVLLYAEVIEMDGIDIKMVHYIHVCCIKCGNKTQFFWNMHFYLYSQQ